MPAVPPDSGDASGGMGGGFAIEASEFQELSDAKLIGRAVRERWDIPRERRPSLVDRLMGIVEKTEVATPCGEGGIMRLEGPADKNAVAAARVLVAMEGQNQADEHKAKPDLHLHGHVEVDDRRTRLNQLAQRLGASELVIDGATVPMAGDIQPAQWPSNGNGKSNGNSGGVCGNGKPGTVEDVPPPRNPGPGANGSGNGHK